MLKIKKNKLYYLVLFLLPVGISGVGLASESALPGNISFADFFAVMLAGVLLFSLKSARKKAPSGNVIKSRVYLFELIYLFLILASIWNFLRFDYVNYKNAILSIFKIIICVFYANLYLGFLVNCSQEEWQKFISIAAISGFIFSLSCMAGALLYFDGIRTSLIDYYVTSFRATGLQEDPNLASIFQLMSISYVLLWRNFYPNKRFSFFVLTCVVVGALLTVSKACVITMTVCLISVLLLSSMSRKDSTTLKLVALIVCAGILIFFLAIKTHFLDMWISRLSSLLSNNANEAFTGRDILWESAFGIVNMSPLNFLFGVGIGQYESAANYYGFLTTSSRTHNTLISFFVDCGVFLPLLIILLFLFLLIRLVILSLSKRDDFSIAVFWGVLAIAIYMNSLNFQNNRMAYVFMIFIVVSLYRMKKGDIYLPKTNMQRRNLDK